MISEVEYQSLRPEGAPPLLTLAQVTELCWNGWISFELKSELQQEINILQNTAKKYFRQDEMPKIGDMNDRNVPDEGYYDVPGEKEYVTFRRSINKRMSLETQVAKIWSQIAALLHRMLCDMSRAGGLPPAAWDPIVKGSLSLPHADCPLIDAPSHMRLFSYEPESGISDKHSDLGILTMCVGHGEGLEVLDRQGMAVKWVKAPRCTILVGQCLRSLSGDHIRTGVHRVVANPVGRQSLVFALRPNMSATVNLRHFGSRGHVNMKDMFMAIKGSRYNVNEKREIREAQEQKNEERDAKRPKQELEDDSPKKYSNGSAAEKQSELPSYQSYMPTVHLFAFTRELKQIPAKAA